MCNIEHGQSTCDWLSNTWAHVNGWAIVEHMWLAEQYLSTCNWLSYDWAYAIRWAIVEHDYMDALAQSMLNLCAHHPKSGKRPSHPETEHGLSSASFWPQVTGWAYFEQTNILEQYMSTCSVCAQITFPIAQSSHLVRLPCCFNVRIASTTHQLPPFIEIAIPYQNKFVMSW